MLFLQSPIFLWTLRELAGRRLCAEESGWGGENSAAGPIWGSVM